MQYQGFARLHLAFPFLGPTEVSVDRVVNSSAKGDLHFEDAEALVDFATKNWMRKWVTTDIWNELSLYHLQKRPFFILVSVDAPITQRWRRYTQK